MFNAFLLKARPGNILAENEIRSVELAIAFKRVGCYDCGFTGVYKYRVQQVRRRPEILTVQDEDPSPDLIEAWKAVPRFAEIPETIKCKRCGEVLGLYTQCIY